MHIAFLYPWICIFGSPGSHYDSPYSAAFYRQHDLEYILKPVYKIEDFWAFILFYFRDADAAIEKERFTHLIFPFP
jgi:hypothetical protein